LWQWRKVIGGAMRAQSLAATNQARLLLGPANVVRIEPSLIGGPIEIDDYRRAVNELLPVVNHAVMANRDRVQAMFLACRSDRFSLASYRSSTENRSPRRLRARSAISASTSRMPSLWLRARRCSI
jgi:hypothetical protein